MKIIDGRGAILGRIASYIAKELLRGEEVIILNCDDILISGNKKDIKEKILRKKKRVGSGQKGPKYSMTSEKIVKRCVRGMIPKNSRGRLAYKRLKCYRGVPSQLNKGKIIPGARMVVPSKYIKISDVLKNE